MVDDFPQPGKPTMDLLVGTWGPDGPPVRKKAGNDQKEKIIKSMAKTIGASCTCSGRTDVDKNLALATRLYERLEKQGLV